MKTVNFFGHRVSKLIVGDNPFRGISYIEHIVSRSELFDYHTAEKIIETLFKLEEYGYNTILPNYELFTLHLLREYEHSGGKMKYIFQSYMRKEYEEEAESIRQLNNSIGIYLSGVETDAFYENGDPKKTLQLIERSRNLFGTDFPVGIAAHRPEVIALAEKEEWKVDFYMASLHNTRLPRRDVQSGFFRERPTNKIVLYPEDRPVMLDVLKSVEKPILAYKIFAGGQIFLNKTESEIRETVRGVYEEVFSALKPDDMAVIGVFQRDKNQAKENAEIFAEWDAERSGK